jgi:hypothetical protein
MRLKTVFKYSYLLCLYFVAADSFCQTQPVGTAIDASFRTLQMEGKLRPEYSLMIRPIETSLALFQDSGVLRAGKRNNRVELLPMYINVKFNSHHPYGWNDKGMINAKGLQTSISPGIYAKYKAIDIKLQPEFVWSANNSYQTNGNYGPPSFTSHNKLLPGESALRVSSNQIAFSLTSSNSWWGPGIYNSLLMSNNAPGFTHLNFHSKRPLKTRIGYFEWQLIGGKLFDADSLPYENYYSKYKILNKEWRYVNGLSITYNPRWTPGFFLGINRVFQVYHSKLKIPPTNILQSYFPVITSLFKTNTSNEDEKGKDQLLSVFARWMIKNERAEIYIEYGFNDHAYNIRDIVLSPTHSAAYIFGFQKLFSTRKGELIQVNFELTQLSQTPNALVRDAGNWYVHTPIIQGYTNFNQVLGAGVGSGNNVQTLEFQWIANSDKHGIFVERIEHDPLLSQTKWTDFSLGVSKQKKIRKLLLATRLQLVKSFNYAWDGESDKFNFYGHLTLTHNF